MILRLTIFFTSAIVWLSGLTLSGCKSWSRSSPYAPLSEGASDSAKAQRLTRQAAALIQDDPEKAERLLREALSTDVMFGPAHNDLGVIHLNRGQLYEAASEFEWARKLMPGHPDPRMNLALTLERAGRADEAMATYETALEVYPNHLPTLQALSRLRVRTGQMDDRTRGFLRQIALEGETEQWRSWAQERLALGTGPTSSPAVPASRTDTIHN